MNTPSPFKANKETSIHGFKMGYTQLATTDGLISKPFSDTNSLTMALAYNLYIVELTVYKDGLVKKTNKSFHLLKEALAYFKSLKKEHKLKIVDQT